jgi:hypothetical protein
MARPLRPSVRRLIRHHGDIPVVASTLQRPGGPGDPGGRAACQDLGYDGPWGVEVLSAQLRELPMREMYRRAYQATAAQFRPDPATPTGPGASPREGA